MPSLARFALENPVVIVTGASRGIGRVTATEAVESGAKIAVGSRTTTELANLAAEVTASGGECWYSALDVEDVASIQSFMEAIIAHYDRIDVLINSADYNKFAKILDSDEKPMTKLSTQI